MLTDVRVLDLLYRKIEPGRILRELLDGSIDGIENSKAGVFRDNTLFLEYAESTLYGFSEDEQSLLYDYVQQVADDWCGGLERVQCEFLVPLMAFSGRHLKIEGGVPVCRTGMALDWRDAYLRIGQDLLVCAFLVNRDYRNLIKRKDFTWPVILRTDNSELYTILGEGIAENHNHLNGGTLSFQITWCRLMNYPEQIRKELISFRDGNLTYGIHRGSREGIMDLYEILELAALLRSILFRCLHRDAFINDDSRRRLTDHRSTGFLHGNSAFHESLTFSGEQAFGEEYRSFWGERGNNILERIVGSLRIDYGVKLNVMGHSSYCLDYALEPEFAQQHADSGVRLLIGERAFLYRCMQECLSENGFTAFEKKLFYLYIVLQCKFRSEMIQNNMQVGFKNFQHYQNRKGDTWYYTPYFSEAVRLALNNRLSAEQIISLEGRMVPDRSPRENIRILKLYDTAKRFNDCRESLAMNRSLYEFDSDTEWRQFSNAPWFYVFHFIKRRDDRPLRGPSFWMIQCRHENLRQTVIEQARALADALNTSPYFRSRVRGIDAASNEFLCRPEVFAVAYRFLDAMQTDWNALNDGMQDSVPIRLGKTFHAGEDFLDIVEGLRAIDEAVEFLHLDSGCRIGHALALGVDVEVHYHKKHLVVVTTQQERLDDLVWLLFRSKELGVTIPYSLEASLTGEANHLFRDIYGTAVNSNGWECNLQDYRYSMKLRGDDPSVYQTRRYVPPRMSGDEIVRYYVDTTDEILEHYRVNERIAGMCYYYQYGIEEAICGSRTYTFKVTEEYRTLMYAVQKAMMEEVGRKRIIIECNPSSNVLIGTFGDYRLHPVFRFNNRHLDRYKRSESNPSNDCQQPQMHVSINTDDLGVFDTTLEFEYALIYEALTDPDNNTMYPFSGDRDVMEYIENLRKMGIRATFPPAAQR